MNAEGGARKDKGTLEKGSLFLVSRCGFAGRRADRGSTFLIVLSILTLLVVTAATLTYTSGLEVRAAGNFGEAVEARMAAYSGLPAATAAILDRPGMAVAYTQRWANSAEVSSRQAAQAAAGRAGARDQARGQAKARLEWTHAEQALVQIEDEGGKLALNCLSAEARARASDAAPPSQFDLEDLRSLVQRVATNRDLRGVDSDLLAQSILAKLYGPDGKLGGPMEEEEKESALDDGELADLPLLPSDPRFPSSGDDQPFVSLDQLLSLEGMPREPALAQQALGALSSVLAVHTQCRLAYEINGETRDCLDPNTAGPEQIVEALRQAYPDLDQAVLRRWALNVVDRRDEDLVPTAWPHDDSPTPMLGLERTPYLYEVWPDSLTTTEDGDDGQYFEIYNPYDEPIDLNGWSVKIGLTGTRVSLHGAIEARGFLVVTDDLDESLDPTPEDRQAEYGSFFDIFGEIGDGGRRKVLVDPFLDLPDDSGGLFLHDAKGNLIDWFSYSGMRLGGVRRSAQRADPRLRSWTIQPCSPLDRNPSDQTDPSEFGPDPLCDQPFASPAGLFNVFAGSAADKGQAEAQEPDYPRLRESRVGLDARLIDLFAVMEPKDQPYVQRQTESKLPAPAQEEPAAPVKGGEGLRPVETEKKLQEAPVALSAGRVNLNTAPLPVLLALPGMTEELAKRILAWRASVAQAPASSPAFSLSAGGKAPFDSLSAFLLNAAIWEGISPEDELKLFRHFANLATCNSQVFLVHSQNQTPAAPDQRRPSQSRICSLILVDAQGRPSALNWRFVQ